MVQVVEHALAGRHVDKVPVGAVLSGLCVFCCWGFWGLAVAGGTLSVVISATGGPDAPSRGDTDAASGVHGALLAGSVAPPKLF